jgi:mono/diheme cytochrome c family protein
MKPTALAFRGSSRATVAAVTMAVATTVVPLPAPAADGSEAFTQYCGVCHGVDGEGLDGAGVDLLGSDFVRGASERELVEFLQTGRLADDPASRTGRPMPEFSWLSETELQTIAAFLKSAGSSSLRN